MMLKGSVKLPGGPFLLFLAQEPCAGQPWNPLLKVQICRALPGRMSAGRCAGKPGNDKSDKRCFLIQIVVLKDTTIE